MKSLRKGKIVLRKGNPSIVNKSWIPSIQKLMPTNMLTKISADGVLSVLTLADAILSYWD